MTLVVDDSLNSAKKLVFYVRFSVEQLCSKAVGDFGSGSHDTFRKAFRHRVSAFFALPVARRRRYDEVRRQSIVNPRFLAVVLPTNIHKVT